MTARYWIILVAIGAAFGVSFAFNEVLLGSYGPLPGDAGVTRFAVLSTKTLRKSRTIALRGSWAYDAISPDGSVLYLIQYTELGRSISYRVRAYDLRHVACWRARSSIRRSARGSCVAGP